MSRYVMDCPPILTRHHTLIMRVLIKSLAGPLSTLEVPDSASVLDLKTAIAHCNPGFHVSRQRLLVHRDEAIELIDHSRSLTSYGLQNCDEVCLVMANARALEPVCNM
jgi:hypothetical protein